jgi:low affinity Fe/Cu permease
VNLKEQVLLMRGFGDKSNKAIATLYANATRDFGRFEESIGEGLKVVNETDRFLKSLKLELKRELNEYAVKVGEMNSENWKTGTILQNKQTSLETILNSTKTEIQNGLRALMVLIGKISNKEPPQSDESQINKLNEKIDSNFEKVFFAQNLFMDSCYRLQMDESQIESKISDILEKLIETFEQKTAIEIKDIKNLEKVIKNHDGHVTRNLHQANTNIVSLYEKMTQGHRQFDGNLKKVTDHLNALFSLIQDTLADENGALSSKNVNVSVRIQNGVFVRNGSKLYFFQLLLRDLKEMEKKISSLYRRSDDITSSVEEIKGIVERLDRGNSTEMIDEYFRNISRIIAGMEAKVNTAYLYYYYNRSKIDAINQNLTQKLGEVTDAIKDNMGSSNDGVESSTTPESTENKRERTKKLIAQIFGKKAEANDTTPTERSVLTNCDPDMQSIIDVRSNFDCETQTELQETTEHLEAKTTVKQPEEDEYEEANLQQVAV